MYISFNIPWYIPIYMVNEADVKIYDVGSRHSINLPSALVTDSSFPFKPREPLRIKIEGKKLVITRGK
jgi:hypothetical protein